MAKKTKKKTTKRSAAKGRANSVSVLILENADLVTVKATGKGGTFQGGVSKAAINAESLQNAVDQNLGLVVRRALG